MFAKQQPAPVLQTHNAAFQDEPTGASLSPITNHDDLAPKNSKAQDTSRSDKDQDLSSKIHTENQPARSPDMKRKHICGLRRRTFWLLFGAVVLIIGIAAILGGVLGSRNRSSRANPEPASASNASTTSTASSTYPTVTPTTTPLRTQVGSGFAMIDPLTENNGSMKLIYWQDSAGNIVEGQYPNAEFVQSSNSTVVQAADAMTRTPLSAVAWMGGDKVAHRALFYVGANYELMVTNATSDTWSRPYNILGDNDTIAKGARGLAACVDDSDAFGGIHVFYASELWDFIAEVDLKFGENADAVTEWIISGYFPGTDVNAGFACTLVGSVATTYYRNASTEDLEVWGWDYSDESNLWHIDATQKGPIPGVIDIAAWDGTDDERNHYADIVWQDVTDGNLQLSKQTGNNITQIRALHEAYNGTKVAGLRNADGKWVIYQSNEGDNSEIKFERLDSEDVGVDSRGLVMGR